jgi:integrase
MKVSLKNRPLKNGMESLYLDYYKGYKRTNEGKIKHIRKQEKLNLYIKSEPKNKEERLQNKETLIKAEKALIKRQAEINENKFEFTSEEKLKTNFIDYFTQCMEKRKTNESNYGNWKSCLKHLISFCNPDTTTLKDINEKFLEDFKNYILTKPLVRETEKLSRNSAVSYYNKVKACINEAYDSKLISVNPAKRIKGIKASDTVREFLTFEEIQKLAKTDCRYDVLKRAFLFSCLTGLRWSDINNLKWSDVQKFNGGYRITFKQQKTKGMEYLDISEQANNLLGAATEPEERVFKGLKYSAYMNTALSQWCLKAGIIKHITFHSGRHTFATLQLTYGTDVTVIQKLLGHKFLSTTMVYAKIIDEKKKEAVNKIPNLNINIY